MILVIGKYTVITRCFIKDCLNDAIKWGPTVAIANNYSGVCMTHIHHLALNNGAVFNSLDDVKAHIAMEEL